jgi:predicted phosphodiesterase
MKILCIADTHFRKLKPRNRLDKDYLATQISKYKWVEQLALEHSAVIAHGGDVTDTWEQSDWVKQAIFEAMLPTDKIAVWGQHDLRNHKFRDNCSLSVLVASKHVLIAGKDPIRYEDEKVSFYGASWNEDVPEIVTPDDFNVLLTHRMVVDNERLWEAQERFVTAQNFLTDTSFDLIVSGDNHQTFTYRSGSQTLINPGSLMRSKIDQINHKPCVFMFDTSNLTFEQFFIPCKPPEVVLDLERVEDEKSRYEKLNDFTQALIEDREQSGLDFEENAREAEKAVGLEEGVSEIVWEIIAAAKNNG